ncbi:DMT family transporter [Alicyclobacillus fastidiosus]|uniref:DMT family transporter n=2 Tax=Alicyclobacillus fastidiosus TaxID=392011 RepID=A0ABY6ZP12_9BACL|nr:DMT family transporter [Alicyclobacillus fastidiosus]WAH44723.1 DMT family transporter [Alicyclobacillus fastidiosus]
MKSTSVAGKKFDHFKGLSMVLLGAVLWGVSGTAAQVLFQRDGFQSGWLVSVRMSIAGMLLLAGVSIKSGPMRTIAVWKDKRDALKLVLFGIIGLLGVQYSYFSSIRYGNAATGTMLQYMGPIFITGYLALRQRRLPSISQFAAVFLALAGALLLVTNGDFHSFSIAPLAFFWGLVSAITLAFYSLYPQVLLQKYDSATIVGWAMLIGGIGMSFITPPWRYTGHSSLGAWWLVSFVVLFGTLVAFYVYISSLKYITASEASLLSCGEPLSASIIAVAFLHVQMGLPAMIGGVCILVTVAILALNRPAERPVPITEKSSRR